MQVLVASTQKFVKTEHLFDRHKSPCLRLGRVNRNLRVVRQSSEFRALMTVAIIKIVIFAVMLNMDCRCIEGLKNRNKFFVLNAVFYRLYRKR